MSVVDTVVHPPIAVALLPAAGAVALGDPSRAGARQRTSVSDVSRPWRVEPPTLASVEAGRSRSIATELLIVEPPATPLLRTARAGTVVATGDVPPSEAGRARPALVATRGGDAARTLSDFSAALRAGRRVARGTAGAVVGPGDVVVLQLPNARRDVARDVARPRLGFAGPPVRIVAFADGGRVTADVITAEAFEVPRGTERLVVVGQGLPDPKVPLSAAGLAGWHAGLELPYVGWSTAIGPGCTVRTRGELISRHRERVGAGWIRGAELAAGTTTLITRFASPIRTVVLVLDDPEALGANVGQRDLRLGLGGAERASDTAGAPIPPVVLAAENRSVLAYAIEPGGDQPVTVTIVSEPGWSVVGVLGSTDLDPRGAIGTVTARGLDTATTSLATGRAGATRIAWIKAEEKR